MAEDKITYFAETDSRNKRAKFGIKASDRTRHVYVIGKTGMGKSTLLENMAVQDIQNGEGMAFIDPHGKTAELLLRYVPQHRIKDVVYFAPFDTDNPISFNVMEDIGPDKRHLVAAGLMSAFKKLWVDAWSARMEHILNNTILALLEYPGATLLGVNRMLTDKDFRKKVVDNVSDPSVKSYWVDEFAKYTDKFAADATPAIQNKVGQFTTNPLIRNIIGQPKSSFDLRQMMDEKKIMIINLSKGRLGEANANLLGSMLITKIYLAAMSRADMKEQTLKKMPNFYLYVDEFQSFANESFADILSEARKYKLNLTIAHQYIEQMSEEVRAAVFGNVGTMITFRVGSFDAEVLEKEFAPQFIAEDLVNLGMFQIYLKLMIDGVSSAPFSAATMAPIPEQEINYRNDVLESSREQFAHNRLEVEEKIRTWYDETFVEKREPRDSREGDVQGQDRGQGGRDNRDNRGPRDNGDQRDFRGPTQGQNFSRGGQRSGGPRQDFRRQDNFSKPFPRPQTDTRPAPVMPIEEERDNTDFVPLTKIVIPQVAIKTEIKKEQPIVVPEDKPPYKEVVVDIAKDIPKEMEVKLVQTIVQQPSVQTAPNIVIEKREPQVIVREASRVVDNGQNSQPAVHSKIFVPTSRPTEPLRQNQPFPNGNNNQGGNNKPNFGGKKASVENMSELKSLLSSVMKKSEEEKKPKVEIKVPENVQKVPEVVQKTVVEQTPISNQKTAPEAPKLQPEAIKAVSEPVKAEVKAEGPKEIPKEELQKILKV